MRAIKLTIIAVLFVTINASAQFFAGGVANLSAYNGKSEKPKTQEVSHSSYGFNLAPEIGMIISDKLAAGVGVHLGMSDRQRQKNNDIHTNFGVNLFTDYTIATFGRLNIITRASLPLKYKRISEKFEDSKVATTSDFSFGLEVSPLMTYDLTDRFELVTTLNFMSLKLHISSSTHKLETSGDESKKSHLSFHAGANSRKFIDTGAINIGIRYKFL